MTPVSDMILQAAETWCMLEPKAVKFVVSAPDALFQSLRSELDVLRTMIGVPDVSGNEITINCNDLEIRVVPGIASLSVTACDEKWWPLHSWC